MSDIGIQEPLLLITVILWLWATIDILKAEFKNNSDKTVWLIIFLFIPVLLYLIYSVLNDKAPQVLSSFIIISAIVIISGCIIYYKVGKKQQVIKKKE